ncbi:MAG: hypothetical protein HUU47_11170 [Bacteroidetes bacterium]|nr:hypothetical protein [Bacteroidota bacterium]
MKISNKIILITVFAGIVSCKRELNTSWDAEYTLPIAQAEMDISDLTGDSLLIKNSNNSLDLVYDYSLAVDSINNYLEVPDTLQSKSVTLASLMLENRKMSDTITLGEIYPLSKLLDGQTMPLEAFDIKSSSGQDIDVTKDFFKQAKFKEGYIDMTLSNDLPVEAEKIVFMLVNKADQQIIVYDSFLNVLPGASASTSKSLAGKKIDGVLTGIVKQVKTKASSGAVLINSKKGIRLDLSIRDIKLDFATAVFPAQDLLVENQEVQYNFGNSQVTYMEIKSGFVIMEVFSNVQEEIILDYSIPNSSRNFNPNDYVKQTVRVPPAKNGSFSKVVKQFPLDGYAVSYKGKTPDVPPFKYNTVYSEFKARIEYTGIERTISLSDSVFVRFGLVDIKPKLAIGDFGKREFSFVQKNKIKAFENLKGNISLEDVKLSIGFKNTFGIEADMTLESIAGTNNRMSKTVSLLSPQLPGVFTIERAKNNPFVPFYYTLNFDKSNSNIKQFLENLPDEINSSFSMVVRPRGSFDYTDFVFDTSRLSVNLRLEMPVEFGTDGLELSRLQGFNLRNIKNIDKVKSAVLKLEVINGYPLEAYTDIEFLDNNETLLATLNEPGSILTALPANTDINGLVTNPLTSTLIYEIPSAKMMIIKKAAKIRIKTSFKTIEGKRFKIYSNYKLKVKLKGNFIYENGF